MSPHSHDVELPPSPTDVTPLLYDSEVLTAATAAWAITESGQWMIFRGPKTPHLTQAEAKRIGNEWHEQNIRHDRLLTLPSMLRSAKDAIAYQVRIASLRNMAETYDLQVFTGMKGSPELFRFFR